MSSMTDDKLESNYKGNALLHLLSYMKPYAGWGYALSGACAGTYGI